MICKMAFRHHIRRRARHGASPDPLMGPVAPPDAQEIVAHDAPQLLDPPAGDPLSQLAFIRSTMESAAVFTSVPGRGQIFIGLTALIAAYIAAQSPLATNSQRWLLIWMSEATLAGAIGALTMHHKAKQAGQSLLTGVGRKVMMNLMPALFAGGLLTIVMHLWGYDRAIPPMWMLLYGTAVISGGAFSVSIVPVMGLLFLALGSIMAFSPLAWVDWQMAFGFGVLHIIFGTLITRKHGG